MTDKVRENRLRRTAQRRGYVLARSRRRDRHAPDFGTYTLTRTREGEQVGRRQVASRLSGLDEVERVLNSPDAAQRRT